MTRRLLELARRWVGLAVSLLSLAGFASAIAFLEDARAMLAEHAGAAALLIGLAFVGGLGASDLALTGSRRAKRRARVSALEKLFATMSQRRRQMVATAMDCGEVMCPALDGDVQALCEAGILVAPRYVHVSNGNPYSINPDVVLEIRDHRDEWLDC